MNGKFAIFQENSGEAKLKNLKKEGPRMGLKVFN